MKEIYKPIRGFEGRYMVSNFGNVMSLNYQNTKTPKVLTPVKHHGGYLIVHLGKSKIRMIHTLVAEAFVENPNGKKIVNHKDGNKHNNNATNLEWVTYKENIDHAIRTGLKDPHKNNHPKGRDVVNSRSVVQYSKAGEFIRSWDCISDAARHINCKPCMIVNNASGRTKSCHGYVWKYSD